MTTQTKAKAKATRTTSNTGKPTTREKAAKPALTVRKSVVTLSGQIRGAETKLSNLLLKATDLFITGDLNEKEKDVILEAIPRQRRADFKAIVEAPDNYREEKEYPTGLQSRARYCKLRADGLKPKDAADVAGNKKKRSEVEGQKKPAGGKAPGNQPGETEKRENPSPDEVGGLHDLESVVIKLRKEVAEYGPEAKKAFAAFAAAAESLSKAMAKG
tara:strand:+ start:173 stop:820 length:648 start_codon:yes stop_codon:yes gene_type:complete